MPAQDKDSPTRYSESLFSAQTPPPADRSQQQDALELRRRRRIFRRIGLPLCLLGLGLLAFLLRKPIKDIITFKEPDFEAMQQQLTEADARRSELGEEERLAIAENQKRYGNQEAEIIISLRFLDEQFAPEGILELAYAAVDRKPSEIGLVLDFRQPLAEELDDSSIQINGQSEISWSSKGKKRDLVLQPGMTEEDFAAALEGLHERHYGICTHPLKVQLSPELQERRKKREEAALPKIIPALDRDSIDLPPSDKTLILPAFKAETSALPQK